MMSTFCSGFGIFPGISGAGDKLMSVAKTSMPHAGQFFVELEKQNEELLGVISKYELQILENQQTQPDLLKSLFWFEKMTDYISLVDKMEELIDKTLIDDLSGLFSQARSKLLMALIFAIVVSVFSPAVTAFYGHRTRKMRGKMRAFAEKLSGKRKELKAETERAELLLYQMIPEQIAAKLKHGQEVMPENYQSVTVYFSDIFGFAELTNKSTPFQVRTHNACLFF